MSLIDLFKKFLKSELGQAMIEYVLILSLISVVVIGSLGGIGGKVEDTFDKIEFEESEGAEEEVPGDGSEGVETPEETPEEDLDRI